ncbi:MAG: ATP-binding protein [Deltaproteobacteria bacterium]
MIVLQEQRNNPRLNTYLGSSLKDEYNDKKNFSIAKNLSITGAYLTTKKQFETGSILDCTVSLDDDAINFSGEIVRKIDESSCFGYGVQITNIEEDDQKRLEQYIGEGFSKKAVYLEPHYSSDSSAQSDVLYNDGAAYDIEYIKTDGKESRLVQAGFPFYASVEDYDYTYQAPMVQGQIDDLLSMSWVEETNNVIFFGPAGSGKTHMAVAIGSKAIENGYKVSFVTLSELLNLLKPESNTADNRYKINRILESRVVIIDEMGYQPVSKQEANMLFQFISKIYGKASIVMTTDLTYEQLKESLGDSTVTNLLLDKLTHSIWLRNIIN